MPNRFEQVQKKVQAEAEDSFIDPRFGRLADKYTTNFQDAPDESWTDPRFSSAPTEVNNPLKDEIVRFANEDADAQRILAAAGVRDQSAKSGFRTRTRRGKWEGTAQWDPSEKAWVINAQREDGEVRTLFIHGPGPDDADGAKIKASGELAEYDRTGQVRVLGPDQTLLIQRLASRDPNEAFEQGLAMLFRDVADEAGPGFDPYSVIASEAYQPVLKELTWTIFIASKLGDKMSAEQAEQFEAFAERYIGNRPWNLSVVQSAFDAFRNEKVMANLQKLDKQTQQPETVTADDLDNLTEEEIDATYDSVSREYIRSLRRNRH